MRPRRDDDDDGDVCCGLQSYGARICVVRVFVHVVRRRLQSGRWNVAYYKTYARPGGGGAEIVRAAVENARAVGSSVC